MRLRKQRPAPAPTTKPSKPHWRQHLDYQERPNREDLNADHEVFMDSIRAGGHAALAARPAAAAAGQAQRRPVTGIAGRWRAWRDPQARQTRKRTGAGNGARRCRKRRLAPDGTPVSPPEVYAEVQQHEALIRRDDGRVRLPVSIEYVGTKADGTAGVEPSGVRCRPRHRAAPGCRGDDHHRSRARPVLRLAADGGRDDVDAAVAQLGADAAEHSRPVLVAEDREVTLELEVEARAHASSRCGR